MSRGIFVLLSSHSDLAQTISRHGNRIWIPRGIANDALLSVYPEERSDEGSVFAFQMLFLRRPPAWQTGFI